MKIRIDWPSAAGLYLVIVCPLLVFTPILQAVNRWRTWEQIAWALAVALGAWCWFAHRDGKAHS